MDADIVIRGGTVVDGTGAPGRIADVAVSGDRITAIGDGLTGRRSLDAAGCVVAPGFIDIHTHYDAQVFWDPALTPSCFHGVTTVIAGNCGFSIAPTRPDHHEVIARTLENVEDMDVDTLAAGIPWDFESFPEYLASVERRGTALNFGAYLGHTALRLYALGLDAYERAATDDEIERMRAIVREAMDAGAMGLATSFAVTHQGIDGKPIPSRHAELREFEALCQVLAEVGRGVIEVTPGDQLGIPEMYDFQRRIGRPMTYTALMTFGGSERQLAELNTAERARGAWVWPQVSPRPLTFSMSMREPFTLNVAAPFAELIGRDEAARLAAYGDAEWRARAVAALEASPVRPRWSQYTFMESASHPELLGRTVREVAAEQGADPLELLCRIAVEDGLETRIRTIFANGDPDGVDFLLRRSDCTLGLSDAGAHVGQLCDAPQATDLLGNWVRERGTLTVEEAVRKLTSQQAAIYGLAERGELREGAFADVCVFDLATVAPGPLRRVRDFPADAERFTADQPGGIVHVLVNGTPITEDGTPKLPAEDLRPGRIVRPA